MIVAPPALPFPGYKWRWASVTPSEGLNESDVFLGVLRAIRSNEGQPKQSAAFQADLNVVELDTNTTVTLARDRQRNILRNSGQYWQALGLYEGSAPRLTLTPFGRDVADGRVTQGEFAAATVRTLELPNRLIEPQATVAAWVAAGLRLKPLSLILEVLAELQRSRGRGEDYLTREELVRIVIPLAGVGAPIGSHVATIAGFRAGAIALAGWPDCAPGANDKRMASEFLLFLATYGYCVIDGLSFHLSLTADEVDALAGVVALAPATTVVAIRAVGAAEPAQRRRVLAMQTYRPGQAAFRRDVMAVADRCLLSGETFLPALQAAHIRPVASQGPDHVSNGIALRSDLHVLFDSNHIRIGPTGVLAFSEALTAVAASGYLALPPAVTWPGHVDMGHVRWRFRYT